MRHGYPRNTTGTVEGNRENRNRDCDLIWKYSSLAGQERLGGELRKKWSLGVFELFALGLGEG